MRFHLGWVAHAAVYFSGASAHPVVAVVAREIGLAVAIEAEDAFAVAAVGGKMRERSKKVKVGKMWKKCKNGKSVKSEIFKKSV